jgi:hypothetical protein
MAEIEDPDAGHRSGKQPPIGATPNIGVLEKLPDECPPINATARTGDFYRLTSNHLKRGEIAPANDWILPYQKSAGECAGKIESCACHAHSLMTDPSDYVSGCSLSPWMRRKSLALVTLDRTMGVILETPSDLVDSHVDWWPSTQSLFPHAEVIEEAEE